MAQPPTAQQPAHLMALAAPKSPQPPKAEVLIIGGGIMGSSVAWHLAAAGVRDIVVLERDELGSGSSAKPLGGVRATFSDSGNIALGHRSLAAFERFEAELGVPIGLRQVGYLFLCRNQSQLASVETSVRLQNAMGCNSRLVDPAEILALNPYVDESVLIGGSFSPRDGYAEPARVVAGYASAAGKLGVDFREQTEVLGARRGVGGWLVTTQWGEIAATAVILTAGAWAERIGSMFELKLPVEPVRRQIGVTRPAAIALPTVPFTLDLETTLYFHNCGAGWLLGISNTDEAPGFGRDFSRGWTTAFNQAASVVAPRLVDQELAAGWSGLYENTPDHNAMIGRAGNGVLYAVGFSGHGFLQGPAVGEVVRDLYLGRDPFLDPAPFSADRFGSGDLLAETHII